MPEHTELLPDPLPAEPLEVVARWLRDAWAARTQPNANAMVLATASRDGRPAARVVLAKDIVPQPGYVVFYTNHHSAKGRELGDNPRAAAVMHWDALHRQVRIEGPVVDSPAAESDAYFASRSWDKRLGAWASEQSQPIGSRAALQEQVASAARRFGAPLPGAPGTAGGKLAIDIPRPPHWGGYRLWAESVELWAEGEGRIHDRARWTRTLSPAPGGAAFTTGLWQVTRLQP
ncbi:MAG TPA: pyridoxamine 5'-phosphate oxidase [Steroidobacteraceae bacterium]|nr:pyridoxamine 5'-phosphate oxidase [Steroidobacteraceae bacterium]